MNDKPRTIFTQGVRGSGRKGIIFPLCMLCTLLAVVFILLLITSSAHQNPVATWVLGPQNSDFSNAAKEHHLGSGTHVSYDQDPQGKRLSVLHLREADDKFKPCPGVPLSAKPHHNPMWDQVVGPIGHIPHIDSAKVTNDGIFVYADNYSVRDANFALMTALKMFADAVHDCTVSK
jgi:hypothetical protein